MAGCSGFVSGAGGAIGDLNGLVKRKVDRTSDSQAAWTGEGLPVYVQQSLYNKWLMTFNELLHLHSTNACGEKLFSV